MTDERNELAQMIKGIAQKASKSLYSRSTEDIEQDLWVKVLETEARKGHELDLNLAGRVCWDYVNDMKDYDQRRNHFTTDFSGSDESGEGSDSDFIGAHADKGNYDSDVALDGLFNMFPEGSKERMYLDFWGNETNARPNKNAIPPSSRKNDGFTEDALAKMLGYSSMSSGGYKKFRDKMRGIISDYYKDNQ